MNDIAHPDLCIILLMHFLHHSISSIDCANPIFFLTQVKLYPQLTDFISGGKRGKQSLAKHGCNVADFDRAVVRGSFTVCHANRLQRVISYGSRWKKEQS